MIDDRDPLLVLADRTTSPERATQAVEELRRAGFADPEGIAHDFGWRRGDNGRADAERIARGFGWSLGEERQ
ncbi:hypothetical protein ABT369_39575 [Dactylosporangium sp. NPDC000244]|uniref:hypothetical protein n=1 Tax=Dactylosporangium sp. NPDC000244 TaxID=3154365 RepID=UPI0033208A76